MNAVQTQIYHHISDELKISSPVGLRSQYTNINSPFSIWYMAISKLARPGKYLEADWQTVTAQLMEELQCVQAVTTLAANLGLLNAAMGQIYTNTYNQVVQMTGLPEHQEQQPDTPVNIIMPHVLDKLKDAVIDQAKSFIGSEAVGIAVACFDYANNKLAEKHKLSDGNQPLTIACSQLAEASAQIVVDSELARGVFQTAILSDWGKLRACGEAITSGIWYWSPKTNYEVLKPLGRAIELKFYQTLMPVKWKIILCETLQHYQFPGNPFMSFVPIYSLMYKMMDDASRNRIYWWWACLEVGSSVEQFTQGTCPNQQLLERIFSLDTTPLDFFTGNKGWHLDVATVAGYQPPPEGVDWQEYRNYPHPF